MGTIVGRTRKDGSKAFIAQIVIKKGGAIVHREAQTFDRRPAANAWIVKRESELKQPGGLEQKEDPTLSAVIDRYIEEHLPTKTAGKQRTQIAEQRIRKDFMRSPGPLRHDDERHEDASTMHWGLPGGSGAKILTRPGPPGKSAGH
jgi:hypothetical protein